MIFTLICVASVVSMFITGKTTRLGMMSLLYGMVIITGAAFFIFMFPTIPFDLEQPPTKADAPEWLAAKPTRLPHWVAFKFMDGTAEVPITEHQANFAPDGHLRRMEFKVSFADAARAVKASAEMAKMFRLPFVPHNEVPDQIEGFNFTLGTWGVRYETWNVGVNNASVARYGAGVHLVLQRS